MEDYCKIDYNNEKIPVVKDTFYTRHGKRAIDIILSCLGIIGSSPLYLIISLLELKFHGRPIMYVSRRPGKDEKVFSIYKFRSMTNEEDTDGKLLPEEQRVTKFGKFLRRTSLDEIPEFFNILKGDMSIIGPRPLLIEYLPLYSDRHKYRHKIRPGLVCLKLKKDRRQWTWEEQFENDIWYVENCSLMVDIKMMLRLIEEELRGSEERTSGNREGFEGYNFTGSTTT